MLYVITKSLRGAFFNSDHLVCTKHLKDNMLRYLQDKIGCVSKDRQDIVDIIFGSDGVIDSIMTQLKTLCDLEPFCSSNTMRNNLSINLGRMSLNHCRKGSFQGCGLQITVNP